MMDILLGMIAVFILMAIFLLYAILDKRNQYHENPIKKVTVYEPEIPLEVQKELAKQQKEAEEEERLLKQKEQQRQRDFLEMMSYDVDKAYAKKVRTE